MREKEDLAAILKNEKKNDRLVRDRKRSMDTGRQREGVQGKDVAPAHPRSYLPERAMC